MHLNSKGQPCDCGWGKDRKQVTASTNDRCPLCATPGMTPGDEGWVCQNCSEYIPYSIKPYAEEPQAEWPAKPQPQNVWEAIDTHNDDGVFTSVEDPAVYEHPDNPRKFPVIRPGKGWPAMNDWRNSSNGGNA